ncbi:MAG: iron-containing alcohol dehydrogenase [Phycisphaerales bacterium]
MQPMFDFQMPTRIVHGCGSVGRVGEIVREHGCARVLLVTDHGLVEAGHVERLAAILRAAELDVTLFSEVHENPTTADVDACVVVARAADVDGIVALGGGSSLDCAKGCNFILTNGGRMHDYWGVGKAHCDMLPFFAVPTTTGTGSELQSFALISDAETHQKMACGDRRAAARVAVLDPELATSQPRDVIACTGLDTLSHALETAVTLKRSPMSLLFSRESFRRAVRSFERVLVNASDMEAMSDMMLAAAYGGLAIEHSMLGGAHALANPLTANFDLVHGHAVALMLSHVIRYNMHDAGALKDYAAHSRIAGMSGTTERELVHAILGYLAHIMKVAEAPATLEEANITVSGAQIDQLAEQAAAQWTAGFNPRPLAADVMAELYRNVRSSS